MHGVATPVFYKGEQIGERRKFDEGLTRFLLRCRAPDRYSGWTNNKEVRAPDERATWFDEARSALIAKLAADDPTLLDGQVFRADGS